VCATQLNNNKTTGIFLTLLHTSPECGLGKINETLGGNKIIDVRLSERESGVKLEISIYLFQVF